jgi:hypothetical protein
MTEVDQALEDARRAHLYLGYVAGLSAALDTLRDAAPSVRAPIFKLMLEVKESNVREIISAMRKIRDDRLRNKS